MKRVELNYDWPPKPIDDKTKSRNRKRVFKGLRKYLLQRSPHKDIRKVLNNTDKDHLEVMLTPEYDNVVPVRDVDIADIFQHEDLSDAQIDEITSEIWSMHYEVRMLIFGDHKFVQNDVCRLSIPQPSMDIPIETSTDVVNNLHKSVRLRVAQSVCMACIEQKEDFFHLWDIDSDKEVQQKISSLPDDLPRMQGADIKTLTEIGSDRDKNDESPWQTLYEYEMLRRFYIDTINGTLEVPEASMTYFNHHHDDYDDDEIEFSEDEF